MDQPIRTRPNLARKVWTTRRKLMGNIVPLLLSLPFGIVGVWHMWKTGQYFNLGLGLFALFPVVAWLSANYLGLFQNRTMRREMQMRLRAARPTITARRYFVGIATPNHHSLLDPHEDIGYLILHDERIEFFGEKINLQVERSCLTAVRFRPNPHSLVGLGRWVSIEGMYNGSPIRLNVELREKDSLMANKIIGNAFRKRIEVWMKEKEAPGKIP